MAKNKISDLRDHLFAALEGLADTDTPMEIERAKALCDVAQTIINSAKVEVDVLRVIGGSRPSEFFESSHGDRLLEAGEHEQVGRGFGNYGVGCATGEYKNPRNCITPSLDTNKKANR